MEPINILPLESTFQSVHAIIYSYGMIDDEYLLDYFMKNVSLNRPSKIMILSFNIEGEVSILTIKFNGKSIEFINDETNTSSRQLYTYSGDSIRITIDHYYAMTYELYDNNKLVTKMFTYIKNTKTKKHRTKIKRR